MRAKTIVYVEVLCKCQTTDVTCQVVSVTFTVLSDIQNNCSKENFILFCKIQKRNISELETIFDIIEFAILTI